MWRAAASIVAGLVTWLVVVTLLNVGLRAALPGYHAAEATLQFTLAMKAGRLNRRSAYFISGAACLGSSMP